MEANKIIGPGTETCGTPEETEILSELIQQSAFDYSKK